MYPMQDTKTALPKKVLMPKQAVTSSTKNENEAIYPIFVLIEWQAPSAISCCQNSQSQQINLLPYYYVFSYGGVTFIGYID